MPVISKRSFMKGLSISTLGVTLPSPSLSREWHQLSVGIFPYLPALKIEDLYSPFAVDLERLLQCSVLLRTRGSFEKFVVSLYADQFDIALMHPFMFLDLKEGHGMKPVAKVDQHLQGVYLARRKCDLKDFADLRGKVLALPPKESGISILAIRALADSGLFPGTNVTLRHFQWKPSCIHAVINREADGCVLPTFALKQSQSLDTSELMSVDYTRSVPGLIFAARPGLPDHIIETIKTTLLHWSPNGQGKEILARLGWPGLQPVTNEDLELLRSVLPSHLAEIAG